ncbi:MAG: GSCFA domain-containing protein [Prolixibacteraceae bacterium]|nr:GSCFA domain-containing protein [Prolixibacteraceae bacterium]
MMNLRTEVILPKINRQLSYRKNAMMMGSCFTENIGKYLKDHYFPILTNPCGILYNPASLANCTEFLISGKQLTATDLFYANGLWNSFLFHSRFSHPDQHTALTGMNESLANASLQLRSASHLFLTFGTSWIYREKEQNTIVGNCHKLPASRFLRERLSVDEMTAQWIYVLNRLFAIQPDLDVVLTVSPIRHFKDGSFENQISKSGLFLMIDRLQVYFGKGKISYFPSYEIVMDELRDYRFYAQDMLHLSEVAIEFVQEKFNEVFMEKESREICFTVDKIVKSLAHKPFHNENSDYLDLLSRLEGEVSILASKHPGIDLQDLIIDIVQKRGV